MSIAPGAHVAIVGASGAGKSTLVGLLLGWHRPASGQVMVDGKRLEGARLDGLRRETAWIDPAVQLWNRSLADNLDFGRTGTAGLPVGARVADADLRPLIAQLPDGLQTSLGEGGALLSGACGSDAHSDARRRVSRSSTSRSAGWSARDARRCCAGRESAGATRH